MRNAFEAWIGQEVVMQLGFGSIRMSLRGLLLRDQEETLLIRPQAGADIEIAKTKVLAIEEVERRLKSLQWRALFMSFIKNEADQGIQPMSKPELKEAPSMDKAAPMLVVSSEFTNCNALRDILSREGWKAIYASTVGECEEVFAKQDIDIVFCERRLTDGTYRDILAMTHSRRPRVRLVVTSRLADWDEYLEAVHDGAYDLIASPIQTADIARVLNQAHYEDQLTDAPLAANEVPATSAGVRA